MKRNGSIGFFVHAGKTGIAKSTCPHSVDVHEILIASMTNQCLPLELRSSIEWCGSCNTVRTYFIDMTKPFRDK